MAFRKITEYAKNIKDLPNRPSDAGITPDELKSWFDGRTDEEIKELFNALIDELTGNTAAAQIGAGAVSADDTSEENVQAKLLFLKACMDALQKDIQATVLDPRVLPDGSVTREKLSRDVVTLHVSDTPPTSFPCLWLDTSGNTDAAEIDAMLLTGDTSTDILAEVDGVTYGVANASVGAGGTEQKKYNFTII